MAFDGRDENADVRSVLAELDFENAFEFARGETCRLDGTEKRHGNFSAGRNAQGAVQVGSLEEIYFKEIVGIDAVFSFVAV